MDISRRPFAAITDLNGEALTWAATAVLLIAGSLYPAPSLDLPRAVMTGLGTLIPVVIMASLLAGALAVGRWSDRAVASISGRPASAVVLASAVGAVTPVCGLGVLPLIATLLRRGVPIAPVMAFWVSSPVMGPSMVIVTVGVLGVDFAVAKGLAAFGTGVLAGMVAAWVLGRETPGHTMMRPDQMEQAGCMADNEGFWHEAWGNARLVLRWLALALVLEVLVQRLVPDSWIQSMFGAGSAASVPLAAIVGAPLYLDGYAALPLVRGLMELGMGFGAALAFMVSGAAVSLYAAVAVAAIVRMRVFGLYVALAVIGAIASGYVADWLVAPHLGALAPTD